MNKYYITAAIPYVNAKPHIGHALEFIQADTIARYHRLLGDNVCLLSGGDENSLKNVREAEGAGQGIQAFVDKNTARFKQIAYDLNTQFDVWQKSSDKNHYLASQKLWNLCDKAGDIYKKSYQGLYCVGCEAFYIPEDLDENGECAEHPGKKLEKIEEENYFFKLSKYQNRLIELIESNQYHIVPEFRKQEILSFLRSGLLDFSISRSNERAKKWGVPVPGDDNQRMYVWFDALNVYQSGIGFATDEKKYNAWWPADLHVIGKGIIRFHAVYWPAILLSAGLALPKKLFVHEYFMLNGYKMSKSGGNIYDPYDVITKYGAEALRYYCLSKISPFQDGDFSEEKLRESYNSDLANGLGNLVARVAKLAEKHALMALDVNKVFDPQVEEHLKEFRFNNALSLIWQRIKELDKIINEEKPWDLEEKKARELLTDLVFKIQIIAYNLEPFLPITSDKILTQFSGKIKSAKPLFPRI